MAIGFIALASRAVDSIGMSEEYLFAFAEPSRPVFASIFERLYDSPHLTPAEVTRLAGELAGIVSALERDGVAAWPDHERVRPTEANVVHARAVFSRLGDFFAAAAAARSAVACDSD